MTTPTLPALIDQMIGLAHDHEPAAAYTILSGVNPIRGADWIAGKKVYQFFPVAQTRVIPDNLVVLAPAPDNARLGLVREFHANLTSGLITAISDPTTDTTPTVRAEHHDVG